MNQIRLLIADDHPIVRRGLVDLMVTTADILVVGEAFDGKMALELAEELSPDVLLLDLLMPNKSGLEVIQTVNTRFPSIRILALTSYSDDEKVFSAIKFGALGYILKDSTPEELLQAIRNVHQGVSSLHPRIALKVIRELQGSVKGAENDVDGLTSRELEVLNLVAEGLSNQEIAEKLCISPKTTSKHVSNILSKLHLANRTQVALYVLKQKPSSDDID